jgi:FAD/FMN-containing dehydrogenase
MGDDSMTEVQIRTLKGGTIALSNDILTALHSELHGSLCLPDEAGYDEARTIWNAMIDRRPGAVVRCRAASDVIGAVRLARDNGLLVAARGGGHNIAGNAVCEGGLVIDLSPMRSVHVDSKERIARVEPGVTLGEFDREAQSFGLATPLGINSTTGVAGLTLGGGFGWLSRKFGLAADNLNSADVVTADGELLHASATKNPDLFWAIRGGGGNFGLATSFEFKLHPVGPELVSGLIVHPFARARELLAGYREIAAAAPDELTIWVVLRKAPPLPFLSSDVHGKEVLVFAVCYCGAPSDAEGTVAPLRALGKPLADVIGPQPYAAWQTAFDPPAHTRRLQLLEIAQFHGAQRRAARYAGRLCRHASDGGMRDFHWPARGRHQPGSRRCDRLSPPRRKFRDECTYAVARARRRAGLDQMGARTLCGDRSTRHRWGLCELHA